MIVYKKPIFEDDSYYFVLENKDELRESSGEYLFLKRIAFAREDVSKESLAKFFDLPSFTGVKNHVNLMGTIYTASAGYKNDLPYVDIIRTVKENKDKSRRCVVRLADSLRDYMCEFTNTSCLNIIHYYKDSVKLFFRASDMENELLYDLQLIKEFFVDPVYDVTPDIHVIASTAQKICNPIKLIKDGS